MDFPMKREKKIKVLYIESFQTINKITLSIRFFWQVNVMKALVNN